MAATGGPKKKGKKKGVTLNLNEFLANSSGSSAGPGSSYVLANKSSSWADEATSEDADVSTSYRDNDASLPSRMQLPTAPRSSQPVSIDYTKLPDKPPFTVYLGNIPFDCSEEDITGFLTKCNVSNVRFPKDGDGRFKGFCYAEVDDMESLTTALSLNDESLRNRRIKVDLATQDSHLRGDRGEDRYDRTQDDWRKPFDDQPTWDRGGDRSSARGSSSIGDQDWGRGKDIQEDKRGGSGGGGFENWDRRGGGRYDDRRGGGFDDRRGGGFEDRRGGGYDDRRGGGFEDRRGGGFEDRRGGGFEDRRGGFDDRRGGGFESRRDGGFEDRRGGGYDDKRSGGYDDRRGYDRGGRGGGRSFGSGYNDDRGGESNYPRKTESDSMSEQRDSGRERKKLVLTKRSQPVESDSANTVSSIFGSAKPVDTAAREREIEDKLKRQHVAESFERKRHDSEKEVVHREKPERTRTESETSGGSHEGRTRHSSSGSGRSGPRPVMIRRESERSNEEDTVFNKDDAASTPVATSPIAREPTSPTSPRSYTDDSTKVVTPAPPPKQNAWAKRSETVSSPTSSHPPTSPRSPSSPDSLKENPQHRGQAKDGDRLHDEQNRGPQSGRDSSDSRGGKSGKRTNADKPQEKYSPRKPQDMPKYEEPAPKDWTQPNMFSSLEEDS